MLTSEYCEGERGRERGREGGGERGGERGEGEKGIRKREGEACACSHNLMKATCTGHA